jgi:hypothetical protein
MTSSFILSFFRGALDSEESSLGLAGDLRVEAVLPFPGVADTPGIKAPDFPQKNEVLGSFWHIISQK